MQKGFNSTLVQLKVNGNKTNLIRIICFNSTLVQLKEPVKTTSGSRSCCFNSTLVQLKELFIGVGSNFKFSFNSTLVQLKAVKNANKYTSKSMIYHPFILIFYKHLQSTFNS
mgnify:CR=1 FL=1